MTSNPGTVYPRVGGATGLTGISIPTCFGLSPRGRGKPWLLSRNRGSSGSIPAWAGQPNMVTHTIPPQRVYPRVGGATKHGNPYYTPSTGLSPRGRGNRLLTESQIDGIRSIPAWAGQPLVDRIPDRRNQVYPRVGGANGRGTGTVWGSLGLSPRGRGNHRRGVGKARMGRSIPAWAGQPRGQCRHESAPRVYPRVGGATTGSVPA